MRFTRGIALGGILLVALALRIGWGLHEPADEESINSLPDQCEYLELGRNLAAGRGLQFFDPRFGQTVWAYRTPGYPVLIALCGGSVRGVRVAQALLDTSTVLAIDLLASSWLGPGVGLIAAGMVAINPLLIYFSALILSETLFTTMLAWGMVLLARRGMRPVAGVMVLVLSVLVRPSAMALPVLLAGAVKRRVGLPVAAAAMTLVCLFPWALRNHLRIDAWVWTSTNSGITRYDGFNSAATGASDQSFVGDMPQLSRMNEVERSKYLSNLADQFIRENPAACVRLAAAKMGRIWSPMPLSRQFSQPLYVVIALAYSVPLFGLALVGLVRRRPRAWGALLMPAIYFTVIHAASVGSLRYRLPVEPPLAVLAAGALGGKSKQDGVSRG